MTLLLFLLFMIPGTFVLGVYEVEQKKLLTKGVDDQILLGTTWFLGGALIFLVGLIWGFPVLKDGFWQAISIAIGINLVSQPIFIRALKLSDASIVAPMRLLTPILTVVTGFFILHEEPTFGGVAGILIAMIGFWIILFPTGGWKITHIFEKGVILAIIGSALFAVSLPFDKKAVLTSSASVAAGLGLSIMGGISLLISFAFRRRLFSFNDFIKWKKDFVIITLLEALGSYLTAGALNYALVAYAASLKRLWSFWTVLLAGQILKEGERKRRIFATLIMFLGIMVTVIWG